jgi:hypothetical protein
MLDLRRRDFFTLLSGAAVGWPLAARAHQPAMPVIGFLRSTSSADSVHLLGAFRHGLNQAGYVEGQNVTIEYARADNQLDRLPALVAELLRRPVTIIVGNTPSALAAKRNHDGADRLCGRGRPGQGWPRRQPQPARRQRHRCQLHFGGTWGKAAWALA